MDTLPQVLPLEGDPPEACPPAPVEPVVAQVIVNKNG